MYSGEQFASSALSYSITFRIFIIVGVGGSTLVSFSAFTLVSQQKKIGGLTTSKSIRKSTVSTAM